MDDVCVPEVAAAMTAPQSQDSGGGPASLQERRPRTLKHGDMFALFDSAGNIRGGAGAPDGI